MFRFVKSEKGMSLTELLVSAALLLIVMGAVYTLLVVGQDIFRTGDKQVAAQQSARIALLRMVKEIRQSYELVDTATYPSPPTSSTTLSARGTQVVEENLTVDVTNNQATSQYSPWLQGASPVVYKKPNGSSTWSIIATGYQSDYTNGYVHSFVPALVAGDEIKASYTRDVYLQYVLEGGNLRRKVYQVSDGATLENTVEAKNVANGAQAVFSRDAGVSPNLISLTLLIDDNPGEPPAAFRLETEIRLRK